MLVLRLLRSLYVFGVILSSYLVQLGLGRLFGEKTAGGDRVLPPWLKARRKRVDLTNARRLLRAMLRLRGVFIKLGQVLSIMGGFLPRVYGKELEQLQDQVPPHPFSDLAAALRASFGKGPDEVFARIEREPIAAASLGQVHVAYLADGRKVAVKFLYPKIRADDRGGHARAQARDQGLPALRPRREDRARPRAARRHAPARDRLPPRGRVHAADGRGLRR